MNKRQKYSKEFKHDAVRLVTEQGYSIAEAMAFLASDDAAYITGQTIRVNGGMSMS